MAFQFCVVGMTYMSVAKRDPERPRRLPDLTKVTGLIGYATKYTLDDILVHVIEYFRKK